MTPTAADLATAWHIINRDSCMDSVCTFQRGCGCSDAIAEALTAARVEVMREWLSYIEAHNGSSRYLSRRIAELTK